MLAQQRNEQALTPKDSPAPAEGEGTPTSTTPPPVQAGPPTEAADPPQSAAQEADPATAGPPPGHPGALPLSNSPHKENHYVDSPGNSLDMYFSFLFEANSF